MKPSELCTNGADGDEPRPSGKAEVQSNEQIVFTLQYGIFRAIVRQRIAQSAT